MRFSKPLAAAAAAIAVVTVLALVTTGCGSAKVPTSAQSASAAAAVASAAPGVVASAMAPQPTASATAWTEPTAADITRALSAGGFPVSHVIVYTSSTDPNGLLGRPGGYASKTAWVDRRAVAYDARTSGLSYAMTLGTDLKADPGGIDNGGGVEVYPTAQGAEKRCAYLSAFQGGPVGDGYDWTAGCAVLRLSNYLTPQQAKAYQRAFEIAATSD